MQEVSEGSFVLLSLGVTAKFLAEDLYREGYRVIDIGNLDMEYEWFLQGTYDKVPVEKHKITGEEENKKPDISNIWNR